MTGDGWLLLNLAAQIEWNKSLRRCVFAQGSPNLPEDTSGAQHKKQEDTALGSLVTATVVLCSGAMPSFAWTVQAFETKKFPKVETPDS